MRVRMTRADGGTGELPDTPGLPNPGPVTGWDLRGPTTCETIAAADVRAVLARLGPDPLAPRPGDKAKVRAAFARSKKPAGALIMDQPVVSGVGISSGRKAFTNWSWTPPDQQKVCRTKSSTPFGG